tara:strand:- start:733 stop:1443 length:711 start_codon:yes stop_codon:yes gene_type:complete
MAWTNPKTWADGDIPDAADLNTHIKANLDALSTHAHSGAAGDGSAALAPISTVTFANQGSTPAAPGSAKVAVFSESETMKVRAGASGAATVISLTGHVHTLQERQNTTFNSAGSGGDTSISVFANAIGTSEGTVFSRTVDPNSAKSAIVCSYSVHTRDSGAAGTATITWKAKSDGTQFDTGTFTIGSGSNTTHAWTTALIDATDASHTIIVTLQASRSGVSYYTPMTTSSVAEFTV